MSAAGINGIRGSYPVVAEVVSEQTLREKKMENKMGEDQRSPSSKHSLQLGSYMILFRLRLVNLTFQGCDSGLHVRLPVQGSISAREGSNYRVG